MSINNTPTQTPEELFLISHSNTNPDDYLIAITERFRMIGAEHVLITGLPLPGKDLGKLILHQSWGDPEDSRNLLPYVKGSDVLLRSIAALSQPAWWPMGSNDGDWLQSSALVQLIKRTDPRLESCRSIVGIHAHSFDKLQIAICLAGQDITISYKSLCKLANSIVLEFDTFHDHNLLMVTRPGELSNRERMILTLTAEGKTASDIAGELSISQRTVHAHLQNASEKMQAANKTQTVVEAMRYGQIKLR